MFMSINGCSFKWWSYFETWTSVVTSQLVCQRVEETIWSVAVELQIEQLIAEEIFAHFGVDFILVKFQSVSGYHQMVDDFMYKCQRKSDIQWHRLQMVWQVTSIMTVYTCTSSTWGWYSLSGSKPVFLLCLHHSRIQTDHNSAEDIANQLWLSVEGLFYILTRRENNLSCSWWNYYFLNWKILI